MQVMGSWCRYCIFADPDLDLEEELEERRYPILVTVYLPACIPFWSCRWLAGIISVSIRPPLFA